MPGITKDVLTKSLNDALAPIKAQLSEQRKLLKHQQLIINKQQQQLREQQDKFNVLAKKSQVNSLLFERKLDDLDQYSRRLSLVLHKIKFTHGESPASLRLVVVDELKRLGLAHIVQDVDRAHRYGEKQRTHGYLTQPVIVRFTKWHSRDQFYQKRTQSNFMIYADLTQRRTNLLDFAKNKIEIEKKRGIKRAGVDKNCSLYIISLTGEIRHFNSEIELEACINNIENSCKLITHIHKHLRSYQHPFAFQTVIKPLAPRCDGNCCVDTEVEFNNNQKNAPSFKDVLVGNNCETLQSEATFSPTKELRVELTEENSEVVPD